MKLQSNGIVVRAGELFHLVLWKNCHFEASNRIWRWLIDLETSFMGFFIAFEAKINDFWSNIETFYHLTTSSVCDWLLIVKGQQKIIELVVRPACHPQHRPRPLSWNQCPCGRPSSIADLNFTPSSHWAILWNTLITFWPPLTIWFLITKSLVWRYWHSRTPHSFEAMRGGLLFD